MLNLTDCPLTDDMALAETLLSHRYIGVVPATGDGEAVLVYLTTGGLDGFHLSLTEFLN